jgi:hypothetical protein
MNETPQQDGASVSARQQMPSTDLAGLINFLVDAFPAEKNQPNTPFGWGVLKFDADKNRLSINTYGILRRFLAQKKMRGAFRKTDNTGFLRDLLSPPKNFDAKMGGSLFDEIGLSQAVIKLKRLIATEIEQLGISAENILIADPASALQTLARQTGIKEFFQEVSVKMVAMEFAKSKQLIARVLSATEEIQAEDWLKRLSDSMVAMQSEHDDEFDDRQRDKLIETLKQDFDKPDSQVTRFLNFLEDEALARVRLQVSFAIMDSLAAQITKPEQPENLRFIQYVQKVIQLFEHFAVPESLHPLHINLARDYGLNAEFSMTEQLVKATFYNCLPVWAESKTQLFESHSTDTLTKGVSIIRDVSYRFRVNGRNPRNEKLLSFDARLEDLREKLIDSSELNFPRKPLSEVVFLWLVLNPAIDSDNLLNKAQLLTERLNSREHINRLLADLSSWSADVKGLSDTLIKLLRDKSRPAIDRAQKSVHDLFLVVEQGVVNSSAIERSNGKANNPFKSGEGDERIEWFKHIKITRQPNEVSDCLFSIQVRTRLNDRTLAMQEAGDLALKVIRQPPEQLLNITWRPMRVDEKQSPIKRESRADIHQAWRMGAGIDIWYDPERLKYRNNPSFREEDQRQYRAATATAMAVVVYVILQVLTEKLTKQTGKPLTALMLRFQTQGKQAATEEGDHLVYALSHAIESALMRDIPVRMQGLVSDGSNNVYKDKGAAYALSAAFPLIISAPNQPAVNKVAVIIYTTRPCDEHPNPNSQTGFTFQAKTYLAEAVSQPRSGYRLALNRMQTHVVENDDAFKNPKLIMEEIGRLHADGYEHILLISNDFGNRRLNRSAQRHSPHTQTDFLNKIATKFADVRLYMLRRDVFPATRIHKRDKGESAYEATQLAVHDEFNSVSASKQLRAVYTFATLAIVGDDASRPQSGFCTYFLDTDYRVTNTQWSEQIRADLLLNANGTRDCLLQVLRGLHFLEAEKQPDGGVFKPVLDPFSWVKPSSTGSVGEIEALPSSRRSGKVLLSLPALLSHVTEALHNGRE